MPTRLAQLSYGASNPPRTGAVMTPVFQTSTYRQNAIGDHTGYEYARTQNPTREALEALVVEMGTNRPGEIAGLCRTARPNCGIITNVTPFEPEWEGHVTLEISNTTPLPARIYANEGIAQVLFFESDEVCETSYRDREGKYQGQLGVTLPRA